MDNGEWCKKILTIKPLLVNSKTNHEKCCKSNKNQNSNIRAVGQKSLFYKAVKLIKLVVEPNVSGLIKMRKT